MSVQDLLDNPLKVVNLGLRSFAHDLRAIGVECRQVDVAETSPPDPAETEPTIAPRGE